MYIVDSHRHLIALFKSFKHEELRLPDPAMVLEVSWLVPSMLIKEPGLQTSSRLTEKLAKVWKTHVHHTIWQHQKKIK